MPNMQWYSLLGAVISAAAVAAAYRLGYSAGFSAGHQSGYEDGKRDGAKEGSQRGYAVGYDRGKRARHEKDITPDSESHDKRVWRPKLFLLVAAMVIALLWFTQTRRQENPPMPSTTPVIQYRPLNQ